MNTSTRSHGSARARAWAAVLVTGLLLGQPVPATAETEAEVASEAVEAVPRRKLQPSNARAESVPSVNINTATVAELMFLPRVGQKKAEAIVARRERRKFQRPEDIMDVKGFGRGIYKRLKPFLRVDGATTATAKLKEVG